MYHFILVCRHSLACLLKLQCTYTVARIPLPDFIKFWHSNNFENSVQIHINTALSFIFYFLIFFLTFNNEKDFWNLISSVLIFCCMSNTLSWHRNLDAWYVLVYILILDYVVPIWNCRACIMWKLMLWVFWVVIAIEANAISLKKCRDTGLDFFPNKLPSMFCLWSLINLWRKSIAEPAVQHVDL